MSINIEVKRLRERLFYLKNSKNGYLECLMDIQNKQKYKPNMFINFFVGASVSDRFGADGEAGGIHLIGCRMSLLESLCLRTVIKQPPEA